MFSNPYYIFFETGRIYTSKKYKTEPVQVYLKHVYKSRFANITRSNTESPLLSSVQCWWRNNLKAFSRVRQLFTDKPYKWELVNKNTRVATKTTRFH